MPRPVIHIPPRADYVEYKVRLTPMQAARVRAVTAHDRLPMAEHVRRAMDSYLDMIEVKYHLVDSPVEGSPFLALPPHIPKDR